MTQQKSKYSILIRWSEEDQLYIASLPEWGPYALTHGRTYEQAAKAGREVLESLIETYEQEGHPLPEPELFFFPEAAEEQTPAQQQEARR
jgi:predicted RNase H-like HicB family nuclease